MNRRLPMLLLLLPPAFLGGFAAPAQAVVLDWSAVTWAPGSLSNSYNVDTAIPGNNVTVSVVDSNGRRINDPGTGLGSPDISTTLTGGNSPAQKNLLLAMGLAKATETLTITLTFSAPFAAQLHDVSFMLFDIDLQGGGSGGNNAYQDQIRSITGASGTTTLAPTISGVGSAVTASGTDVNQVLTANAAAADNTSTGNATISFSSDTGINSVTFAFGSGSAVQSNPTNQMIGISNITFTPVPEIDPAWISTAVAVAAAIFVYRRNVRAAR